jgi:hypothetical protein
MTMSIHGTDLVGGESLLRRNSVRLAEFLLSEQIVKTASWFIIGSVFVGLVTARLIGRYHVPIEVLVFLFLGQGLFIVGFHYLQQATFPPKYHPIDDPTG